MKRLLFLIVSTACLSLGCEDSTSLTINQNSQKESSASGNHQNNGQNVGDDDKNGGDNGQNGGDNGQNGGDNGQNGGDNGQNGGDNGQNGSDNGQDGGDNGQNGDDNGQNGDEQPDLPYDVVGGIASGFEGLPCKEGERYCDLTNYAECQNNRYIVIEKCADNPENNLCVDGYGCTRCYPDTKYCKDDGNDVYACSADGRSETFVKACLTYPCSNGECVISGCPEGSQFIYLVDTSYNLIKFDPGDKSGNYLTTLFHIECPGVSATPRSMAVDRDANAWVLFHDNIIRKINIKTQACTDVKDYSPTPWTGGGMAFSLDQVGGSSETLYTGNSSARRFGVIHSQTFEYDDLAYYPSYYDHSPELTGTGLAKLLAFSPGSSQQYINEIDKSTGEVSKTYTLPGAGGYVSAWAFAHWGGYFFMFETVDGSNNIYRFDIVNNKVEPFYIGTPYNVVGAGVSTCAPIEIIN